VSNLNDRATIDVPCPKCGHKTVQSIAWLKTNTQYTCVCGGTVTLESEEFLRELDQIDKSIGNLRSRFKWIK